MSFELTKRQHDLVTLIREEILPELRHLNKEGNSVDDFYDKVIPLLAKRNLLCPTIPTELGGQGLDRLTTAIIIEELATVSASAAAIVDASLHAAEPILLAGSTKQKEHWLPLMVGNNAQPASFALTETTGGSDLSMISTYAEKDDDNLRIIGTKDYVINGSKSSFFSLIAKIARDSSPKAALRVIVVPASLLNRDFIKRKEMAGLDQVDIATIIFDDVFVKPEYVIKENEPGSGYLLVSQTFDLGKAMVAATSVGIAKGAYDLALEFAENRIQFGTKIKNHQAIAFKLAEMATKIELARLITWKACWMIDHGSDYSVISSMAKLSASTIAQQVTSDAADIIGAKGYEKNSAIARMVKDARALSTIEGTNNMQRLIISSQL